MRRVIRSIGHLTAANAAQAPSILFYCDTMSEMAKKIAHISQGRIELGTVKWKRFPDRMPDIMLEDARSIHNRNCIFLASLSSPEVFFEQLAVIYALPRYLANRLHILLPFFPTATMERVAKYGEVATAKTLSRMLGHTPLCGSGPPQLTDLLCLRGPYLRMCCQMVDLHTLQQQFYFDESLLVRLESSSSEFLRVLKQEPDHSQMYICFPDEGAHKRFSTQYEEFPQIVCSKIRKGDARVIHVKDEFPAGRHVVIVDDLVNSGSTLIECSNALLAAGAGKVSCYVTHGVFPNEAWKRFMPKASGGLGQGNFDSFWVSDSHPTAQALEGVAPFKIVSLAPLLCRVALE